MDIHKLFEDVAERFSEHTAVDDGSRSVTYRELNANANRVAHALIENGIGGQEIVGLYSNASIGYVTAVLGVLKAGAVFMPLNTQFPDARLGNILNKTKPNIFITSYKPKWQNLYRLWRRKTLCNQYTRRY